MTFDYLSPRESLIFELLKDARDRPEGVTIEEIMDAASKGKIYGLVSSNAANMNIKYLAAKLSMNNAPWRIVRESKPRGRGNTGVFKLETNP